MENPTGIPSQVTIFKMLNDLIDLNGKIFKEISSQQEKLKDVISKAIDEKAWEQGHITAERIL